MTYVITSRAATRTGPGAIRLHSNAVLAFIARELCYAFNFEAMEAKRLADGQRGFR